MRGEIGEEPGSIRRFTSQSVRQDGVSVSFSSPKLRDTKLRDTSLSVREV